MLLNWRTPTEKAYGYTPDISPFLNFCFWDAVYYLDHDSFPSSNEKLGYWLGVTRNCGDAFTYYVYVPETHQVIDRSVLRAVRDSPNHPNLQVARDPNIYEAVHNEAVMDSSDDEADLFHSKNNKLFVDEYDMFIAKNNTLKVFPNFICPSSFYKSDDNSLSSNSYCGSHLSVGHFTEEEIKEINMQEAQENQKDDTFMEDVETLYNDYIDDVDEDINNTNTLVDIYSLTTPSNDNEIYGLKIDNNPELLNYHLLLDHWHQIDKKDGKQGISALWKFNGILKHRQRGSRAEVLVDWNVGSPKWETVSDMKKFDLLTLACYAKDRNLLNKKGWKWAKHIDTTSRSYVRLAKVFKTQARKTRSRQYKFGYALPFNVKDAYALDKANGNSKWADAIAKELAELQLYDSFQVLSRGEKAPKGYQFVPMHMVFDVKYDGQHKARYVMNGNVTPVANDVYAPVASLEIIRILLLIAIMNGLDVKVIDVSCAFLQSKCEEKIYTIAGIEWGKDLVGQILLILKSIYGLRKSAASWFKEFAEALMTLGFVPSLASPCVFMRDNGDTYDYITVWVDDVMIFSKRAEMLMKAITTLYNTKGDGETQYFLGGDVNKVKADYSTLGYTFELSAKTYIVGLADRVEKILGPFKHFHFPMDPSYHPELDESSLLVGDDITIYRMIIGSALWAITLGRYDIMYATTNLARYNIAPREGHLKAAKRIIGYLKHYCKGRILIDSRDFEMPPEVVIPEVQADWAVHYPDAEEELPDNMPEAKMKPLQQTYFVDASHMGNKVTGRSDTGILGFLQSTPSFWYSKSQRTVESASYGSEIVGARIATEALIANRYQLRMLGVPVVTAAILLGDNKSVQTSGSLPSSTLNKKHNALAFHKVREASAASIMLFGWVRTHYNLADLLTKALGGVSHRSLTSYFLFGKGTKFTKGSDKNTAKYEDSIKQIKQ